MVTDAVRDSLRKVLGLNNGVNNRHEFVERLILDDYAGIQVTVDRIISGSVTALPVIDFAVRGCVGLWDVDFWLSELYLDVLGVDRSRRLGWFEK